MFRNLPPMLNGVAIKYLGSEKYLDFKMVHSIEFSYNGVTKVEKIKLPELIEGESYLVDDQYYYPVPCLSKPMVIFNKAKKCIILKNVLTDFLSNYDYDIEFIFNKREGITIKYMGNYLTRSLTAYEMSKFILRPSDRTALNKALGVSGKSFQLEFSDLIKIENLLLEEWESVTDTDWKNLEDMRLCTLEEMLCMVVSMTIPKLLRPFKDTGEIREGILERACRAYLLESSQCQIDLTETPFAQMALHKKIVLPILPYDGELAGDPHPSWFGYIDSVTTPQSEKCGQVVSLCDGVSIKEGKFHRIGEQLYSSVLRKAVSFPQFIKSHRQVMCAGLSKQCCTLGKDGEFNEPQLVFSSECEHIPEIEGRHVLLALMDWRLYTHEDACVISTSLAEKLVTYRHVTSTFVDAEGEMDLSVQEGAKCHPYQTVGTYSSKEPMFLTNQVAGEVIAISKWKDEYEGKVINYAMVTIECRYDCREGSKLSNLHSCKSIVSLILPDEKMPTMEDGTPCEMIISPMSIGNRVNPSLIMEGMLGMYARQKGITIPVKPFDPEITFESTSEKLKSVDLPHDCKFQLTNGSRGKPFPNKTFVGTVFLMRLHHHADEKLSWQNMAVSDHHGISVRGRGNTWYGREELEILYQHDAQGVIAEMVANTRKTTIAKLIKGLVNVIGYNYED